MKPRVLLFLLCGCAAVSAAGQVAPARQPLRVNPAAMQIPTVTATETVAPAVLKMPDVRLLRPDSAATQLRRDLHHLPEFTGDGPIVVAQDPPPGADVGPDTKILLTLGVPQLSVTASTVTPAVDEDVVFQVAAEPSSGDIVYSFAWNDGSAESETSVPRATHRFSKAGTYEVVVRARVFGVEMGPVITTISPVAPLPPPPLDTIGTTAVIPTPEPAQPPVNTTTAVNPPSTVPWLTIALIAAAAVAAAALVRVVRRKPPAPSTPPPRVSIRSGLGPTDHTIEHPEQIRNGLSLRLRGGVRQGGADA